MIKEFKIRASQSGKIMGVKGLGQTGLTYIETWLKEQLYQRRNEFNSKYTNKGLQVEDNAIDYVLSELNLGFALKNQKYFENEFFCGTPDVILDDCIIDIKSSWDCFTFPLFDKEVSKDYYYQGQVYMDLLGIDNYKVVYVLMDTPEHLIEAEANKYCFANGYERGDWAIVERFTKKMTYGDIPDSLKIKVFEFKKDQEVIDKLKSRVVECREIIKDLL